MYKINLLNKDKMEWEQLTFNGIPMQFSNKITLLKALKDNLGTSQQILYEDWYLVVLDGSIYQLNWFIENHDRLLEVNNRNRASQVKYESKNEEETSKNNNKKKAKTYEDKRNRN